MNPDPDAGRYYGDYYDYARKLRADDAYRARMTAEAEAHRRRAASEEYMRRAEQAAFLRQARAAEEEKRRKIIGMTPEVPQNVLNMAGEVIGTWTVHSYA